VHPRQNAEGENMTIYHDVKQRTPEWSELRLGKMTGSKLKNIIDVRTMRLKSKPVLKTAACKMIAEQMTGFSCDSDYTSPAMQWGIDGEEDVQVMLGNHPPVGFVTNDKYQYFGISPDVIVGNIGIEIKCPNSDTHISYIVGGEIPSEHLIQCLAYFIAVDELDQVRFISYDPRNAEYGYFKTRLYRNTCVDKLGILAESIMEFETFVGELKEKI